MALRPSSVPLRVPLPPPPASSLFEVLDPESDLVRATSPMVPCLLATVVTDPLFESAAASALVAQLVDLAAACRLDYAFSLVAESESDCPPSFGGECALGADVLEDRQEDFECLAAAVPHLLAMLLAPEGDPDAPDIPTPRSYAEAITGPYSSQWQNAMDVEMASRKSTGTYIDAVPPSGAKIIDGMLIFKVKRPPSSPLFFKARYVSRGFSQREGVDLFLTFSPIPKMTSLRVLLHVAAQRDYELHSLDFNRMAVDSGVDRSHARVQQSTTAAGTSRADVDGQRRSPLRSGGGLPATTHVTAGEIAPAYGYFEFSPDRITVAPLQGRRDLITWRESIEPQLEVARLKGFADCTVPIPSVDDVELRGEFCAAHLLTFMVISRDDLYIAQLEEKMTHIGMGEQESATDYCNRAQRILAEMRMAGAEYLTASYISHIAKGLPRSYNLMKRMMMVPGTRESLDKDSITSYILQDEAMQEAK
ncbi:unnamed protein product [Closterium sp. NIES-54]